MEFESYYWGIMVDTPTDHQALYGAALRRAQQAARQIDESSSLPDHANWTAVYDEWLARATCHSSMAACQAQEGQN